MGLITGDSDLELDPTHKEVLKGLGYTLVGSLGDEEEAVTLLLPVHSNVKFTTATCTQLE
jgi:hypothetical protein